MAAIARFISFDGGIAFSQSSLKIQKRDEYQGKIIPVAEIAAMEVAEPLFGDDGCISIRLNNERTAAGENTLYFDESQYEEAVHFKVAFDTMLEQTRVELPPLDMFQPSALTPRRASRRSIQGSPRPRAEARQTYMAPERPARRPAKKGKLKKIILWIVGGYAALLGIGGIALLLDKDSPEADIGSPTAAPNVLSETWEARDRADTAPDAGSFVDLVKATVSAKTLENEPVTDVILADNDLHITVDYSQSSAVTQSDNWRDTLDDSLVSSNSALAGAVLSLGEQYDGLWNTITVDFGEYGKVVNEKNAVSAADPSGQVAANQQGRVFLAEESRVIHDVPVPGAPEDEEKGAASNAVSGAAAAGQAAGTSAAIGYTSPPAATSPPVPTDPPAATPKPESNQTSYVLNTNTKKFHYPSCKDVKKIKSSNRKDYTGTRDSVIAMGYDPCGHCKP